MNQTLRPASADLGLIGLAVIWGLNFSVVKIVLREIDPLAFNALRFPMAAAVFWIVLRGRGGILRRFPLAPDTGAASHPPLADVPA